MAKQKQDPLKPIFDHHPYRAMFKMPGRVMSKGWAIFDDPSADTPDAGVSALKRIDGVAVVSLHRNEVVILRSPDREWDAMLPELQSALGSHFIDREPFAFPEPESPEGDGEASEAA